MAAHTGENARGVWLRENRRKMKRGKATVKISTNLLILKLNQCMTMCIKLVKCKNMKTTHQQKAKPQQMFHMTTQNVTTQKTTMDQDSRTSERWTNGPDVDLLGP